jgi:holliday junction DNA helicase RuvA
MVYAHSFIEPSLPLRNCQKNVPKWYDSYMLSYLKGAIIHKGNGYLIIENQGIGYRVWVTPEQLATPVGKTVEVWLHQKISETEQELFGLPKAESLAFFEQLLSVNGVGPKIALAILASADIPIIKQAILHNQPETFTHISGVGKKTAERILLELKGKVLDEGPAHSGSLEVLQALTGLGFSQAEVMRVLAEIPPALPTEDQIKQALKYLRPN